MRKEQAGGARDAAELPLAQRLDGAQLIAPRLHFDEGQHVAAPGHDVDLAQFRAIAPRQDAPAFQAQAPDRAPFRRMAEPMGFLPGAGVYLGGRHVFSRFNSSARA